ncbi:uncharacterized protein BDW43DRAFT_263463 [Aspergillus alliaceus]|uniref:uncharacterized protein n=1 Tax=Petromyces alliaceus TaxID=209559 RepID=UPI0012A54FFA|nr:uncharacterized protein BDW43DRAFT_263463 [Aspergillus alliaceus]KAB8237468.1 hypothetical protein BDW43DRAFT_263463 [Aspergillus alliaceus]
MICTVLYGLCPCSRSVSLAVLPPQAANPGKAQPQISECGGVNPRRSHPDPVVRCLNHYPIDL